MLKLDITPAGKDFNRSRRPKEGVRGYRVGHIVHTGPEAEVIDFAAHAEASRKAVADLGIEGVENNGILMAHVDPFNTSIEAGTDVVA